MLFHSCLISCTTRDLILALSYHPFGKIRIWYKTWEFWSLVTINLALCIQCTLFILSFNPGWLFYHCTSLPPVLYIFSILGSQQGLFGVLSAFLHVSIFSCSSPTTSLQRKLILCKQLFESTILESVQQT